MKKPTFIYNILAACCLTVLTLLSSCFTGVESTPAITSKELKKQKIVTTPESLLLADVVPQKPSEWSKGKRFYISDARAVRALWRTEPLIDSDSLLGKTATLLRVDTVPSLTGKPEVSLIFETEHPYVTLEMRPGFTIEQWEALNMLTLPYFIDWDMVDEVNRRLKDSQLYILSGRRIGNDSVDTIGTRYQSVRVIDVVPATEATPLRVRLIDDENHLSSVLMTIGDATTARRNFETIFAIENPRNKYKHISDDNWQLIQKSKVKIGMTPEECRLALGSPDSYTRIPTTAGMVERWTYTNGVYLMFEDGLLSRTNL